MQYASLIALVSASSVAANAPTGLLTDYKRSPAGGVRSVPSFTWVVPACETESDHTLSAYQLTVTHQGRDVWDSGKTAGTDSTYVAYAGPALEAGTAYEWTVSTWTASGAGGSTCASSPSAPSTFITALFDGWGASSFITLAVRLFFSSHLVTSFYPPPPWSLYSLMHAPTCRLGNTAFLLDRAAQYSTTARRNLSLDS
jgi:hypothetical protein